MSGRYDPNRPWADDPTYGGMSDDAAGSSWRAQKERERQEASDSGRIVLFRQASTSGSTADVLTQDDAALMFKDRYQEKLLFDHDSQAWFIWDGCRWRKDTTNLVFEFARQLLRDATAGHSAKSRLSTNNTSFANGVEKFGRSDRTFAVDGAVWDADIFLLGTPKGTVNLRDGALHAADPRNRITKLTAVPPAEASNCPLWLSFLNDATGSDPQLIRYLKQLAGYSLSGAVIEHAMVFVYGSGGNGKSVFINTLAGVMGEYATASAMTTFSASRSNAHPTELARLKGARLVTASETEKGHAWAEAKIKALTGGDRIAARFMKQDFFEFVPQFKLIVVGNHKPTMATVDDAIKRRFTIIPFTRTPTNPDRQLEQKLRNEWPMILRWMIEGCLDWQANGLLRPESVTAITEAYFDDQDLLSQWLAEKCDVEPNNPKKWDTVATLFESWAEYAIGAGEQPGSKKAFSDAMQSRGFHRDRVGKGVRTFRGVRLIIPAGHDDD